MSKIGYGICRKEVPGIIKEALDSVEPHDADPDLRPFPDNKPSVYWIDRFMKRNHNLSARIPEKLGLYLLKNPWYFH